MTIKIRLKCYLIIFGAWVRVELRYVIAPMTGAIKAISFDLWGTLYEGGMLAEDSAHPKRVELISEYLRNHGIYSTEDAVITICRQASKLYFDKWLEQQELFTNHDRLYWIINKFGIAINNHDLEILIRQYEDMDPSTWPKLKTGAEDLVRWVSERVPTVVISDTANMSGRMLREVLQRDQLLDVFYATFFSDEIGNPKPRADLFRAAIARLSIEPRDLLHIGDRVATDGLGASHFGAKFMYVGTREPAAEVQRVSDYVCANLSEVHSLLRSLLMAGV